MEKSQKRNLRKSLGKIFKLEVKYGNKYTPTYRSL